MSDFVMRRLRQPNFFPWHSLFELVRRREYAYSLYLAVLSATVLARSMASRNEWCDNCDGNGAQAFVFCIQTLGQVYILGFC